MTNELVYSRDGLTYHRAMPGVPFLPLGAPGSFDSRMLSPKSIIPREREVLLYYSGSNGDHGSDRGLPFNHVSKGRGAPAAVRGGDLLPSHVEEGQPRRRGMGLARLPGRNFCGLRADFDGMVETKWLCNYGNAGVCAYIDTEKDGWVQGEILDQYGEVIPGWDRASSGTREGEDGQTQFFWGNEHLTGISGQESDAGGKVGHVVKLRFHLHKATLYGFQIGEEGAMPEYTE